MRVMGSVCSVHADCFRHTLLWNNGSVLAVLGEEKGVFVSGDGVVTPAGSTWARNPIPRVVSPFFW